MCTGIPGQILEIIDPIHRIAKVEVSGQPIAEDGLVPSPEHIVVPPNVLTVC